MEPLSAIGAVASVVQLASAALSLSKTLYSLGSAVGSACEDIQILADDLKAFSQSLTLLSRLLEDSKSWYSDDIYLLTAKIIKDCAELYVKIDKILVKLGGNGKKTWKMRVKFVYKEGQIRKLLKRLRDMKGTLATILMSLQVDLQLSLLNISSSSKIQRTPERPLQAETISILKNAQKAVETSEVVSRYTYHSEKSDDCSNESRISTISSFDSFVLLPSSLSAPDTVYKSGILPSPAARGMISSNSALMAHRTAALAQPRIKCMSAMSLTAASSVESFKSALSSQETNSEIIDKIGAIQGVMHAFKTALETLENLVRKRLYEKDEDLWFAARDLKMSLAQGEKEVGDAYESHYKAYEERYIKSFAGSHENDLQKIGAALFEKVVLVLHMQSAPHMVLQAEKFKTLHRESEKCRQQTLLLLSQVVLNIECDTPWEKSPPKALVNQTIKSSEGDSDVQDEHEETTDLFRNSTLGIIELEREESSSSESNEDDEEMYKDGYIDEMEYDQELENSYATSEEEEDSASIGPIGALSNDNALEVKISHDSEEKATQDQLFADAGDAFARASSLRYPSTTEESQPVLSLSQNPKTEEFMRASGMYTMSAEHASSLAEEKRSRNAGAAERFRQRRREKEKNLGTELLQQAISLDESEARVQTYNAEPLSPGTQDVLEELSTQIIDLDVEADLVGLSSLRVEGGEAAKAAEALRFKYCLSSLDGNLHQPSLTTSSTAETNATPLNQAPLVIRLGTPQNIPSLKIYDERASDAPIASLPFIGYTYAHHTMYGLPLNKTQPTPQAQPQRQSDLQDHNISSVSTHLPLGSDAGVNEAQSRRSSSNSGNYGGNHFRGDLEENLHHQDPEQITKKTKLEEFEAVRINDLRLMAIQEKKAKLQKLREARLQRQSTKGNNQSSPSDDSLSSLMEPPHRRALDGKLEKCAVHKPLPVDSWMSIPYLPLANFGEKLSAEDDIVSSSQNKNSLRPQEPDDTAEATRGRRRSRSVSSFHGSERDKLYSRIATTRSNSIDEDHENSNAKITQAGASAAAVPRLAENFRNKSVTHQGNKSKSRLRYGAENVGASLDGAVFAGLNERQEAKKNQATETGEEEVHANKKLGDKYCEDEVACVNPKQFHRILARRTARDRLEKHFGSAAEEKRLNSPTPQSTGCMRRPRGPTGRFLTPDEIAEQKENNRRLAESAREEVWLKFLEKARKRLEHKSQSSVTSQASTDSAGIIIQESDYQYPPMLPDSDMHGEAVVLFDFEVEESQTRFSLKTGEVVWVIKRYGVGHLEVESRITQQKGNIPEEYIRLVRQLQCNLKVENKIAVDQVPSTLLPKASISNEDELASSYINPNHHNSDSKVSAETFVAAPVEFCNDSQQSTVADTSTSIIASPTTSGQQTFGAETPFKPSNPIGDKEFYGEAIALYDFKAEKINELPLRKGERIFVSYNYGAGWVVAEKASLQGGQSGVVPEAYVRLLDPEELSGGSSPSSESTSRGEWRVESAMPGKKMESSSSIQVSNSQRQGLWWQGYQELRKNSQLKLFISLNGTLSHEFGFLTSAYNSDKDICKRVSTLVSRALDAKPNVTTELITVAETRASVIQILKTIESNLGLEVATLGWASVSVFLALYDPILTSSLSISLSKDDIATLRTSFHQLREISGVIARYAVMENLYSQAFATLTLKPEYRASLIDLCVKILEWFSHSFIIAKTLGDVEDSTSSPSNVGFLPLPPENPTFGHLSLAESERRSRELLSEIREKDKGCQGFRVICEMEEDGETETEVEGEETEVEDVSDGSWEMVGSEELFDEGVSVKETRDK